MIFKLKPGQIAWGRTPVRLDLAGGWTDTPPYTNMYGGRVVNLSVNLNGQPPVQVFVQRTEDRGLKLRSIDLDCGLKVETLSQLTDYQNPESSFGLAKAALCQVWKEEVQAQTSLSEILERLNGGLSITTFVAVPKGSGLGTSSVLGACILGTLHRSFGLCPTQNDFVQQVLMLEQMLTTGGGWQDQVGGAIGGVKFGVNHPGLSIQLDIEYLDSELFVPGLSDLFVLFYTGHTRLAKGILSQVVKRVESNDRGYLDLHLRIANLADQMRAAISRRDIDEVGVLLGESWNCKKQIHPSATNPDIDSLMEETKPFCRSACLMGAGGGGYCLFLAKNAEAAKGLRKSLVASTGESPARVVDWQFNPKGLEVSLS